ncbi:hypothetical protein [Pseudomonas cavernae]|uniref:hypothetical protein n=1 Tax=Pseudomonas cavernae TaxID=2320867 RepID=UPI0015A98740|nr:hypothetical protein [Pseudomonas cavernae]
MSLFLHVGAEMLLFTACAVALYCSLRAGHGWRAAGFALMGVAALLGAIEYAGVDDASSAHAAVAQLSARLSLLLIAIGPLAGLGRHLLVVGLAAVLLVVPEPVALASNALALLAIAYRGRSAHWALAISGALLFLGAGLVVGTQGSWLAIPRVDIFHLSLAVAVSAWIGARLSGSGAELGHSEGRLEAARQAKTAESSRV